MALFDDLNIFLDFASFSRYIQIVFWGACFAQNRPKTTKETSKKHRAADVGDNFGQLESQVLLDRALAEIEFVHWDFLTTRRPWELFPNARFLAGGWSLFGPGPSKTGVN